MVDEGGISGILERGFVISSKPITNLLDSGITKLVSTINDNNFSSSFTPTLAGKKHYYRAYAITAESDFLGTEETFTPAAIPGPGYWSDAKPVEGAPDWWESSWFGSYYAPDTNQWIMHSELGWLYPSPSMEAGVWLWKDGLKWLWTDSKTFPFLHSIDQGSWLYFYGNVGRKDCSMPTLPKNGSFWKTGSFRKISITHKILMIRIIINRIWIPIRLNPQIITRLEVSKSQNYS